MLLSVVVVNWNSKGDLRDCLSSLRAQTHQELEVIVVDNGSADGSADMVANEFPEVRLLRETDNLGFAEACNRGITASSGAWVAMLNNDAVAEPDWAKALVDAARVVPSECGMLQSLLLYQSRRDTINSTGIELTRFGGGRDRKEGQPRSAGELPAEVFCPTAGAAAYRRTMLEAVHLSGGYFDRSHFMYYEDMDLGWRARLAGFTAQYVPSSVVYHRWHGSSERHGRSWLLATAGVNRLRTVFKNASLGFTLLAIPGLFEGAFNATRHGGFKGIATLLRAVRESFSARAEVARMARVRRSDIERKWRTRASG
ncbi:MAG TPA: glycosyltransferase family 2 protein [Polyangiaceae bacterium]|nr:glycosyltransferase family 2 protein [Polyangiaceae bacterium]